MGNRSGNSGSCRLFRIDIFTYYDGRWLEYSCKHRGLSNRRSTCKIAMLTIMKLVCVHEPQLHSSYGFCKVNSASAKGYNMRRRTAESCTLASAGCNGASGCTVTNGIRCALGFLNKQSLHIRRCNIKIVCCLE